MNKFDKPVVLLPKGEALEACSSVCQDELGIEPPDFDGLKLSGETQDGKFFFLKPKDIPGLIKNQLGDVAIVGTDIVCEYVYGKASSGDNAKISVKRPKSDVPAMCRLSILALEGFGEGMISEVLKRDSRRGGQLEELATAYPRTLNMIASARDLPFVAYKGLDISGSVEAYPELLMSVGVADLVQTGNTAEKNSLVEMYKLMDIYPEILTQE